MKSADREAEAGRRAIEHQNTMDGLRKLARVLSDRHNITVIFAGNKAFTDGRTIYVPEIPPNADKALIDSIHGYLDHEVGHLLFTDFEAPARAKLTKVEDRIVQHIEDARIESRMGDLYVGAGINFNTTTRWVIDRINQTDTMSRLDPIDRLAYCAGMRSRYYESGDPAYAEFGERYEDEKTKKILDELDGDIKTWSQLQSTDEAIEAARHVVKKLKDLAEPPKNGGGGSDQQSQDSDGEQDGEDGEEQPSGGKPGKDNVDKKENDDKSAEGESGPQPGEQDEPEPDDDQAGAGGDGKSKPEQAEDDDNSDGENDGGSGDEERDDPKDEKPEHEGESSKSDSENSSQEKSENEKSEQGGNQGSSSSSESDEEDDDGDGSAMSDEERDFIKDLIGGGVGAGNSGANFDPTQSALSEYTTQIADLADYRVATTEFDVTVAPVLRSDHTEQEYIKRRDQVVSLAGAAFPTLMRLLSARTQATKLYGRNSGKVNMAQLSQLRAGNAAIFYRKQEGIKLDSYVELVVDCSGSMASGRSRMASLVAICLAELLDKAKVPFGVSGFTNGSFNHHLQSEERQKIALGLIRDDDFIKVLDNSHRVQALIEYNFKSPDAALVKARRDLVAIENPGFMASNADGDSILRIGQRVLKRAEKRKIMIVLSDGQPAAYVGGNIRQNHKTGGVHGGRLRKVINGLSKVPDLEVIGIGIESDCVKDFYPRCMVVHNLSELPKLLVNELGAFLREGQTGIKR